MTPLLVARDLVYAYPDGRRALDGLDVEVAAGERLAVLGPNGAGKTTFALHCNGVLRPQSGEVIVDGVALTDETVAEVRAQVGLVFQDPDDQLFMPTVRQDVAFGPYNLGQRDEGLAARVDRAVDLLEVAHLADRVTHHLSMGEKRRVCLAGVMAMAPSVLVLDEPTANLDPWSRQDLSRLLDGLAVTQIVVTHDLLFALECCPRAVIVDTGRVVASGPTPELLADADLLARHRLVLPRGANPANWARIGTG